MFRSGEEEVRNSVLRWSGINAASCAVGKLRNAQLLPKRSAKSKNTWILGVAQTSAGLVHMEFLSVITTVAVQLGQAQVRTQ